MAVTSCSRVVNIAWHQEDGEVEPPNCASWTGRRESSVPGLGTAAAWAAAAPRKSVSLEPAQSQAV